MREAGLPRGGNFATRTAENNRKEGTLTYVINEPCIGEKDASCVEVCPVDCIHPTPDEPEFEKAEMLYIDPEECIDCDACVEPCPVDAITPEDEVPAEWQHFIERNAAYFRNASS
jgi:NAD-dependent dihydropyrimidine dehydrogenase PreA subunit